jgi:ribosomal protein L29
MKDLIKKTTEELTKDLREKKEALRVFRFGVAGGKVKNVKEGMSIRKEIAQIFTIIGSRKNK